MRKSLPFLFALIAISISAFAQMGVNSDNSPPDPSAMLDVKSTNRGFLPPRMTFEQRNAILNPVEGLIVLCANCNPDGKAILCIFQDGKWRNVMWNCAVPVTPVAGAHISDTNQIVWKWSAVPIARGYKWNRTNDYTTAINQGSATSKTETGLNCLTPYDCYVWAYNDCGASQPLTLSQSTLPKPFPRTVTAGIHVALTDQIEWKWNPVPGATGYKWSAANNYTTATDMEISMSKTETGLICNSRYTRYIWACNGCAISIATTLTQTTKISPASPIAGQHTFLKNQIVWTWNSVPGATGYKWNDKNDYATATNISAGTTKTETGLSPNTTYRRFVWAYNGCGISMVTILAQTISLNYIGQNYGGGIIFFVDSTEVHGLIVAPSDQGNEAQWGCLSTGIPDSRSKDNGQINTTAIVTQCNQAGIAARICNDLELNGYSDWYLPSLNEAKKMLLQTDKIGLVMNSSYWSSTEDGNTNAYCPAMTPAKLMEYKLDKNRYNRVRAIRAF